MFIKVTSEATAQALIKAGFKYMTECVSGKCVYVFEQTPEVIQCLLQFSSADSITDNKLRY